MNDLHDLKDEINRGRRPLQPKSPPRLMLLLAWLPIIILILAIIFVVGLLVYILVIELAASPHALREFLIIVGKIAFPVWLAWGVIYLTARK